MERSYRTVEKSGWGDGPWQDEPDKIQWTDEETGYPCLIVRNHWGSLCGYVGLSRSHPLYEKDYDEVDVDVHGGLTYSNHCQDGPEEEVVCHVPDDGDDDVWWLGFDCGHTWDVQPGMQAFHRQLEAEEIAQGRSGYPWTSLIEHPHETYKDVAYAREEVRRLASQLRWLCRA